MGVFFGTAGIRGPVGPKVNEELAMKLGLSIATLSEGGSVVIGCDYRLSSESLKSALRSGLTLGGAGVHDLGYAATPCMAFAGRELGAKFSVVVTASHNPPSDNGFKVYAGEGYESTLEMEREIEDLILNESFALADWKSAGSLTYRGDMVQEYLTRLAKRFQSFRRKLRVVVDCANGTAGEATPQLLSQLGCDVIAVNETPDGRFPGRLPEPTPENLQTTARLVVEEKADFGIAHDGDGDRLAIIEEKGRYVTNDTLLAYFASLLISEHGPGKVVTSVDTSFRIDETVSALGGAVERTRLGKTHSRLVAPEERREVRLCCEPWKIIDPAWGFWGDAIYAAVAFASHVASVDAPVSALLSSIPDYPQERTAFDCPYSARDSAMKELEDVLRSALNVRDVWNFDGIRANFEDGSWALVRPSGTEPKIRAYCEARERSRLEALQAFVTKAILDAVRRAS